MGDLSFHSDTTLQLVVIYIVISLDSKCPHQVADRPSMSILSGITCISSIICIAYPTTTIPPTAPRAAAWPFRRLEPAMSWELSIKTAISGRVQDRSCNKSVGIFISDYMPPIAIHTSTTRHTIQKSHNLPAAVPVNIMSAEPITCSIRGDIFWWPRERVRRASPPSTILLHSLKAKIWLLPPTIVDILDGPEVEPALITLSIHGVIVHLC